MSRETGQKRDKEEKYEKLGQKEIGREEGWGKETQRGRGDGGQYPRAMGLPSLDPLYPYFYLA
jgi:hypothetical protein